MNSRLFIKDNLDLILILTLYSLLAVISLKYFNIIGCDEIAYINIAHGYAIGDFSDAINGYWSPLYSWLLTPFFISGFTPLYGVYASKTLALIIGFFTIISLKLLSNVLNMSKISQRSMLFSLMFVILFFALMFSTPDLLVVFLIVTYLSVIFKSDYVDKLIYGVLCGFIGALAYLSKSYAFPFFLAHFILFNIIYYFKDVNSLKKKNILKNLILGLSVFFIISGVWTGLISEKYDKITISTSGEYNHALVGPSYPIHPAFYQGLYKPPNNISNSIWDDLSYVKMNQWSPFESWNSFNRQITILENNAIFAIKIIESFFLIAVILVIATIIFIWKSKSNKITKEKLIYLLITMIIYTFGYCFIAVEWRYLWLISVLLMISGFFIIDNIAKNKEITLNLRNILLILLICGIIIQPLQSIIQLSNEDNSFFDLSEKLKDGYNITGSIASNKWGNTLIISYYMNTKYYGGTKENESLYDLKNELENNNIDYYFVWDSVPISDLSNYKEITNSKIKGLMIYKRIKN
ncbi:MAG TPA: hypothetical protein VK426_10645 [Methanobacterium sp.]|nr:hypothetical protein [Methanobacterium sp.]